MVQSDDCSCVRDLEKLHMADQYAEFLAMEFIESFGEACPEMIDFVVERTIARLAHVAIIGRDELLVHNERKTLDAVADYIFKLSKTAPAALKIIMDDAERKEGPANACN